MIRRTILEIGSRAVPGIRLALALAVAVSASPLQAQSYGPLDPHEELALEIYRAMVRIDTSHETGDATALVEVARDYLLAAGFPPQDVHVFEPAPRKGNLVATLRGSDPNARPLLLLAHIDVVAVEEAQWRYPPFELTEVDGYFWGRGSVDDKDEASIHVVNLIRLKKEGFLPERDVVVVLTAGEEGGGDNGVAWLLENQRGLVDAWFVINEGGGGHLRPDGAPAVNGVQVTEKRSQTFTLRITDDGGHSARPGPTNAIVALSEAVTRVGEYRFPVRFNTVTTGFFEKAAARYPSEIERAMRTLLIDPEDAHADRVMREGDPTLDAFLRTTCQPTGISGGHASNAMPQLAEATVNCRLLPDEDPEHVRRTIEALAGEGVQVQSGSGPAVKPTTSIDPIVYSAIERITEEMWPGVPVVPVMGTGSTDGNRFRQAGIPAYGVSGLFQGVDTSHGANERSRVDGYYRGLEFLYRLTKELSSHPDAG